jgi:hypothetical protein
VTTATYKNWSTKALIASEDAHRHPLANVITRAVGSAEELLIDETVYPLQASRRYVSAV